MRARHFSIAVAGVIALAVTGCGSDNSSSDNSGGGSSSSKQSTPSTSGGGGSSVKLETTEFKFSPSTPSVKKTGTATFTVANKGQTVHALEVEGPGGEKKTGSIQPGQTATLKVDLSKDGTYEFYCPIDGHKQQGMVGKVKVGSGGGSSSSNDNSGGGGGGY